MYVIYSGKFRDPSRDHACVECKLPGQQLTLGSSRTVYIEGKDKAPRYNSLSPLTEEFKVVPALGCVIPDLPSTAAECLAHGVKNFVIRLMSMHSDVGSAKFTQDLRDMKEAHRFGPGCPWLADKHQVFVFESRLVNAIAPKRQKSPFQSPTGASIKAAKKREVYVGSVELRMNRRMIDYVAHKV